MIVRGHIIITHCGSPWRSLAGSITVHGTPQLAAGVAKTNQPRAANVGAGPLSVRPVELRILPPLGGDT